jgi:hypothetical protein
MTTLNEETEAWLAIRKEAAKVDWEYGEVGDPYRLIKPDEGWSCIGRNYFAQAPGSDVWVSFHDLPKSIVDELYKRAVAEGKVMQIMIGPGGERYMRGLPPELGELLAERRQKSSHD